MLFYEVKSSTGPRQTHHVRNKTITKLPKLMLLSKYNKIHIQGVRFFGFNMVHTCDMECETRVRMDRKYSITPRNGDKKDNNIMKPGNSPKSSVHKNSLLTLIASFGFLWAFLIPCIQVYLLLPYLCRVYLLISLVTNRSFLFSGTSTPFIN